MKRRFSLELTAMSNKMRVLTFPRYDFPKPRDDSQTVSSQIFSQNSERVCFNIQQLHTLGSRGYFFLIDTDDLRRSRVNKLFFSR